MPSQSNLLRVPFLFPSPEYLNQAFVKVTINKRSIDHWFLFHSELLEFLDPDQFQALPLRAKILKIIVGELQSLLSEQSKTGVGHEDLGGLDDDDDEVESNFNQKMNRSDYKLWALDMLFLLSTTYLDFRMRIGRTMWWIFHPRANERSFTYQVKPLLPPPPHHHLDVSLQTNLSNDLDSSLTVS